MKRLTISLICLAILFNTFAICFSVSGEESRYLVVQADESGGKTNLLAGKTPLQHIPIFNDSTINFYTNEGDAANFTDGDFLTKADIYNGTNAMFAYDMGAGYRLGKLLLSGMYNSSIDYCTAQYEFYLSDSDSDIFALENRIVSYDNSGEWKAGTQNAGNIQTFVFNDDNQPIGRFLGIKVISPNPTDNVIRISEIGAYETDIPEISVNKTGITDSDVLALGYNRLSGKRPMSHILMDGSNSFYTNEGNVLNLTDGSLSTKVDIYNGNNIQFAYDLGDEYQINKLLVGGMYNQNTDYCTAKYELYLSNVAQTADDIFSEGNRIISYDNTGVWERESSNMPGLAQIFTFRSDVTPSGRYLGIRITDANPTDDAARISEIGAYGNCTLGDNWQQVTAQIELLPENITSYSYPDILGARNAYEQLSLESKTMVGNLSQLIKAEENYEQLGDINTDGSRNIKDLVRIKKYLISGNSSGDITGDGIVKAEDMNWLKKRLLGVGGIKMNIAENERVVSVYGNNVINDDFLGLGVNIIPTSLMPNNLSKGSNHAFFELEKQRLNKIKPKIARVWFQIDWFETQKGVYDFNSEKMQAFYPYLDALQQSGTEVLFNFGWKNGSSIQDWYCCSGGDAAISAPADIDEYAKSCSALINNLIIQRGYTNISYLTFYNEPNGDWDFECPGDQKAYYLQMARCVSNQLKNDGIRDCVEIWGPEEVNAPDWTQYMFDNGSDVFQAFSFHAYNTKLSDLLTQFKLRKECVSENKHVVLTEYADSNPNTAWDTGGHADCLVGAANSGVHAALVWKLCGGWLEDPRTTMNTNDGLLNLFDSIADGGEIPNLAYYQYSVLSAYVPAHSQVLYTTSNAADDIRTTAFKTNDGNYTIVVECADSAARNLKIELKDMQSGLCFERHSYTLQNVPEQNAIIPVCDKSFTASDIISDEIGGNYTVLVYTTLKSQAQVCLSNIKTTIGANEVLQLNASVIDSNGGVSYQIISGGGTVSQDGLFIPDASAQSGDWTAIKVTAVSDPSEYAVALIKIG